MKQNSSKSVTLATFDRTRDPASGKMYEARIVACEYAGYWHVDFRLFFQSDDTWFPSKKGAIVRASEIDDAIAALIEAKKLIN